MRLIIAASFNDTSQDGLLAQQKPAIYSTRRHHDL